MFAVTVGVLAGSMPATAIDYGNKSHDKEGGKTSRMSLEKYNLPIKVFYANLLAMGIKLRVKDGELRVGGNTQLCTPVLQAEIQKRAEHLIALLTPAPSPQLESHFGRLLTLEELKQAFATAEFLREKVDATPCNGGWLLTTPSLDKNVEGEG